MRSVWRMVMKYSKPIVIAEIGCNHKGDMEIAKENDKDSFNLL